MRRVGGGVSEACTLWQRFVGVECGVMPGSLCQWNVGADRGDVSTADARQFPKPPYQCPPWQ